MVAKESSPIAAVDTGPWLHMAALRAAEIKQTAVEMQNAKKIIAISFNSIKIW